MVSSPDPFFADTITATHPSRKRVPANTFMLRLSLASSSGMQCLSEKCKKEDCWPWFGVYCESWLGAGFMEARLVGEPSPYKHTVAPRLLTCRAHDAIVRAARGCSIDSPPASACIALQHEVTMPAAQCDDLRSPHPKLKPLAVTSGPQPQQSTYPRSTPAHTMYQNTAAISSDGRLVVLQRASHAKSATGTNPLGGVLACCCADGQSHADAGC